MIGDAMNTPQPAGEILEREFLPTRAKILEIAATLDRITRGGETIDDPRLERLREAIKLLLELESDRAEQVQLLFSRRYDEDWQKTLAVK